MIAHVAAATEHRGCVVVRLSVTTLISPVILDAAMRVARAFDAEVQSLFIADQRLFTLAGRSDAREFSLTGGQNRDLTLTTLEQDVAVTASALHRDVEITARGFRVPVRRRAMRDEPLRALAFACSESGPWNVVAFAEPLTTGRLVEVREVFVSVLDMTGILLAGPGVRRTSGPVVAVLEDIERLHPTLRVAERLAAVETRDVCLLVTAQTADATSRLELNVRRETAAMPRVHIEPFVLTRGIHAAMETVQRLESSLFIVQFGGNLVAGDSELRVVIQGLPCPVLLVR